MIYNSFEQWDPLLHNKNNPIGVKKVVDGLKECGQSVEITLVNPRDLFNFFFSWKIIGSSTAVVKDVR